MKTRSRAERYLHITIIVVASLLQVACSSPIYTEEKVVEVVPADNVWTFPSEIKVKAPNQQLTRVSYEDNGTQGVKQIWESGDKFVLYNSIGDSVLYTASTINSDGSSATFTLDGYTNLTGGEFYAVYRNGYIKADFTQGYPSYSLNVMGQSQSGTGNSALAQLKQYDLIASEAITDMDQEIVFISKGTLLTIIFGTFSNNAGNPDKLTIEAMNGPVNVFKSNYSSTSPNLSSYTLDVSGYSPHSTQDRAYIMLPPFTMTAGSELAITLSAKGNKEFRYVGKFTNEKNFKAATRYNFSMTSATKFDTYTDEMDQINAYYDNGWATQYKPTTGNGTQSNPYIIATAWNLAWLKAIIKLNGNTYNNSSVYYQLDTNITIDETVDWKEIGDTSISFKANFDGNGNEITGLSITAQNSHEGLFGVTDGATISNLTVSGTVSTSGSGGSYFAGLVGFATNTTIRSCDNYVNVVNNSGGSVGGIIGQSSGLIVVENCNNYGALYGNEGVGGIVGIINNAQSGSKIVSCSNYGDVNCNHRQGGGIVGYDINKELNIISCLNAGNVNGSYNWGSANFGGIAGESYISNITYCTNQGNITGLSNVGTFIGQTFGGTLSSTNTNTGTANGESNKPVGNW